MKYILALGLLLALASPLGAQKPETILGYARKPMSMAYYREQAILWEKETRRDAKNETAWLNWFRATRLLNKFDKEENLSEEEKESRLNRIIQGMEQHIPDSYSLPFCQWQLHPNDPKYLDLLEKAVAIDSTRSDHTDYYTNMGELSGDRSQRDRYSLRKWEAGDLSAGMLYYNHNVLIGLKPNAILLTAGDNDTYPAWALQARGIRPDVQVVNLYLLSLPDYRKRMMKQWGLNAAEIRDEDWPAYLEKELIPALQKNTAKRPVYVALTAAGMCQDNHIVNDDLYLTGVAYEYHPGGMENLAELRRNFEQRYALDYLTLPFYQEIAGEPVQQIAANYLVPLLKLAEHYRSAGDLTRMERIRILLKAVAHSSEDQALIRPYLAP